ncbi:BRO family protein [Bilophila sp.]|uniref:BRO family protein n=1 Tax=Bilophila sp. TaxID=1929485 RepID=UPI003077FADD
MGYTVDKKTGKIILVHDVTVTSKAVNQPETQQQQHQPAVDAALPAVPAAATTPPVSGTFVFPVTKQKVRTVWHEGNIWFVGKDVAECLAYTNPLKAVRDHCKGVNETFIPSAGGRQLIKIIPESDVYRLVMRSKLPAAEQFQTWVCEEVLPSIRKTGGYGRVAPASPAANPKTEDQLILEAMQILLSRTETLKAELAEAKPKADYYDALVDSRDLLTPTEAAKLFDMPARKLTAFLREKPHKWLFKGFDGANIPMQPIIEAGYMQVKHRTSSLNGMHCTQGYFTPKGIEALRKLLKA